MGLKSSYQLITDSDTLAKQCDQWQSCPTLAVDTEFIRTDTFWPKVALIQISNGQQTFLVDPLAIPDEDLLPLKKVLCGNNGPLIILHACYEDLEVFKCMWGCIPQKIFDTQVGAAILGLGLQVGYQRLVADVLQKEVPKGETRSNWLKRPLTASQLDYAALDVAYLTQMHEIFSRSLAEKGRMNWVQEDCDRILQLYQVEEDPFKYYLKFRNAWRFNQEQLRVLEALSSWREETARKHDLPRGFLIKDPVLYRLAEKPPESLTELSNQFEIRKQVLREDGEKLVQIIKIARSSQEPPLKAMPVPLSKNFKPLLAGLKSAAKKVAEANAVPAELLLKKRDLEALVRSSLGENEQTPAAILGNWRYSLMKDHIAASFNQHRELLSRPPKSND